MAQTNPQVITASEASTDEQPLSGWYSWPSVALLSVCCFPVGLYFLWTHPRWTTQTKRNWTGVWLVCVILGALIDRAERKAASQELVQANQLWSEGKKAEAVERYKKLVEKSLDKLPKEDRPTLMSRVVDFDAEKGDEPSARNWIDKARRTDVALALETAAARTLLEKIEGEKKKAETEKKEAQIAKCKLPAFKKLVKKYKNSPDRFASSAERETFNKELAVMQQEFSAIPFDPTKDRDEAKQIIELFEQKIEHQYQGQLYMELEEDVREMYSKMTQ